MIVYCIENTVNGKKYVGITKRSLDVRWANHISYANTAKVKRSFQLAILKYGPDQFIRYVLDTATTWEELKVKEREWIERLGTYESGYNVTKGGDGTKGCRLTEQTRQRMKEAAQNRSYERYQKSADKLRGRTIPSDQRQKMSEAAKRRVRYPFSDEHKKNLAASIKESWARRRQKLQE